MVNVDPREATAPSVAQEAEATAAEIESLQQEIAARQAEAARVAVTGCGGVPMPHAAP